jgi:GNAT superfamily N-acetyltransferase
VFVAAVLLRDISPQDKPALVSFHARLSEDTRYRRYHSAKGDLTSRDLRYLTEVDGHHHVAPVADPAAPSEAEIAIVVADDVHGRGVGAELIEGVIARAAREGAGRIVAQVQGDNHRAMRLFQGFGFRQRSWDGGIRELVRELGPDLPGRA